MDAPTVQVGWCFLILSVPDDRFNWNPWVQHKDFVVSGDPKRRRISMSQAESVLRRPTVRPHMPGDESARRFPARGGSRDRIVRTRHQGYRNWDSRTFGSFNLCWHAQSMSEMSRGGSGPELTRLSHKFGTPGDLCWVSTQMPMSRLFPNCFASPVARTGEQCVVGIRRVSAAHGMVFGSRPGDLGTRNIMLT